MQHPITKDIYFQRLRELRESLLVYENAVSKLLYNSANAQSKATHAQRKHIEQATLACLLAVCASVCLLSDPTNNSWLDFCRVPRPVQVRLRKTNLLACGGGLDSSHTAPTRPRKSFPASTSNNGTSYACLLVLCACEFACDGWSFPCVDGLQLRECACAEVYVCAHHSIDDLCATVACTSKHTCCASVTANEQELSARRGASRTLGKAKELV